MTQSGNSDAIDPEILDQASDWLVRLNAADVSDDDHKAFECWRQACPEHAHAWARAELLMNKLGSLPPSLAMPSLDRPVDKGRRATLNKLLTLLLIAPVGWGSWRFAGSQGWTADYHTASGERRDLQLADGSRVALNTATAIDIYFDDTQRLIRLHQGEILIETGKDAAFTQRSFHIATEQGRMEALGTRFNVRQRQGRTEIAVLEGAVRIAPKQADKADQIVLSAGEQASFTNNAISAVKQVEAAATAWTRGMLLADKMRLADFISELARYRSGILRCDPAIADLPISGAFPVSDTDQSLNMLVSTYPIAMASRMGGLWVTLLPSKNRS